MTDSNVVVDFIIIFSSVFFCVSSAASRAPFATSKSARASSTALFASNSASDWACFVASACCRSLSAAALDPVAASSAAVVPSTSWSAVAIAVGSVPAAIRPRIISAAVFASVAIVNMATCSFSFCSAN